MNSAFLNKKILSKNRSLFMTNKFESKCLQKFYVSSKHEKECYMKTTSYLEEPNRHFCQHFMRRTTQQTFLAINLASQQKTTKLYFSSQVGKQFKLLTVPFTLLRCCWRSGEVVKCISMFENSAKSIKSYLFMVSSRILLRSLRVYILKQLLFSISVNSGFRNIYRAARVGV